MGRSIQLPTQLCTVVKQGMEVSKFIITVKPMRYNPTSRDQPTLRDQLLSIISCLMWFHIPLGEDHLIIGFIDFFS